MLNGKIVDIIFNEVSIDPPNITHPNQLLVGDLFRIVSNNYVTNLFHSIKNVIIESDNGFLTEDISKSTYFQRDETTVSNIFEKEDYFVCYMLQLSPSIDVYKRSYLKAQDIAAQIGGIVNFLMILGKLFSYSVNKSLYSLYLTNFLFNFRKNEKSEQELSRFQGNKIFEDSKSKMESEISKINNFMESTNKKIMQTPNIKILKETKQESNLRMEFKEYFRVFFCFFLTRFQNKKLRFLNESYYYIQSKLSLEEILKNNIQFEKLKNVLFDEDQLILFNNRRKILVENLNFPFPKKMQEVDEEKLLKSFHILKNRCETNKTDQKLLKIFKLEPHREKQLNI